MNTPASPTTDELTEALRARGFHVTAPRLAVLRVLTTHPHATADEVVDAVSGEIGAVSRQAVYDSLNAFTEEGLIRRVQPAHSQARYETRIDDNHHHLVCRHCGRTEDVDCATGETPCLEASDNLGFDIDEAEVIYWGLCPSCQEVSPG